MVIEKSEMNVRRADAADAQGMASVLEALVLAGKRRKRADAAFVLAHYIEHANTIRCHVALDAKGEILGFQSLKRASPGNPYGTPVGWGIIGTHVAPSAARRGVGRHLFAASKEAAQRVGIKTIEALIGVGNAEGLAFYEALGFRTISADDKACRKVFEVGA